MKPSEKTRVVEVYASMTGLKVRLTCRTWWHKFGSPERHDPTTRMVVATMNVPLTDDDLLKYVEGMARFCVNPQKRAFRPPNALVWREIAFGQDETHEHGADRDGRQFIADPLPLFDGSTQGPDGATIPMRPEGVKAAPPKAARSSARAPMIRTLGKGGRRFLPGG